MNGKQYPQLSRKAQEYLKELHDLARYGLGFTVGFYNHDKAMWELINANLVYVSKSQVDGDTYRLNS